MQILERALSGFDFGEQPYQRLEPDALAAVGAQTLRAHLPRQAGGGSAGRPGSEDEPGPCGRSIATWCRALEAIARTTKQLDQLAMVQAAVGRRIAELVDYEKQYRGFIEAKTAAVAPPGHQPSRIESGRLETSHIDSAALEEGLLSRFRGGRGVARAEMGEAISFEDVLTVLTVLLLLRMVFMVPLVNLDKAKTISARTRQVLVDASVLRLVASRGSVRDGAKANNFIS